MSHIEPVIFCIGCVYSVESSVVIKIETNKLIFNVNQLSGFYFAEKLVLIIVTDLLSDWTTQNNMKIKQRNN